MFDIHQPIDNDGDRDEKRYEAVYDALLPAFAESPEGKACAGAQVRIGGWAEMFLDYYFDYLGSSVGDITRSDAAEVVFELIPRKVSTEPESAPEIIQELRAFWAFLGREHHLPQAPAIVAMLSDDAIVELKGLLADPRNFGMAKSFIMQGLAAGFDMTTEEGLQAFTAEYNASLSARPAAGERPLTGAKVLPHRADPFFAIPKVQQSGTARKEKRKQRKAERKSRKRNRR